MTEFQKLQLNTYRFGVQLKVDRPKHVRCLNRSQSFSRLGLDRFLADDIRRLAFFLGVQIPPQASLENKRGLGACLQGLANQKRSQHFVTEDRETAQGRPSNDIMDASDLHRPHMMGFVDITDVTRAQRVTTTARHGG